MLILALGCRLEHYEQQEADSQAGHVNANRVPANSSTNAAQQ